MRRGLTQFDLFILQLAAQNLPQTSFFLPLLTFYNSDVFCVEMLDHIVQQYATSYVFTSRLMRHWKTALEQKYSAVPGITEMHDILVVRKYGKVTLQHCKLCVGGEYSYCIIANAILSIVYLTCYHMSQLNCLPRNFIISRNSTQSILNRMFLCMSFLPSSRRHRLLHFLLHVSLHLSQGKDCVPSQGVMDLDTLTQQGNAICVKETALWHLKIPRST